jgi:hypothetical protein
MFSTGKHEVMKSGSSDIELSLPAFLFSSFLVFLFNPVE